MNIIEDKYFMHLDPELEKRGYVAKDVHSLRFKYVYTEEEQAERHQLFEHRQSTTQWLNFCNKDAPMRSEHMAAIMEAISKAFICYQYDDKSGVSYESYQWDLFFWCNDFSNTQSGSGLTGRDYSYFTLTFNERMSRQERLDLCDRVLTFLKGQFNDDLHLEVAIQYKEWRDDARIQQDVRRIRSEFDGVRCTTSLGEGRFVLYDGHVVFMRKYAKHKGYSMSSMELLKIALERNLGGIAVA